ncbi:hypothetical protein ACB094_09G019100 [Castanea mollissima]
MGTNSLQEIWACDLDIHHCIQESQRIYLGPTLMELQASTKCVSSNINDGPIQRFVKIKFYENVESSVNELSGLTLVKVSDLVEVLHDRLGIIEMPTMMVMMPGMVPRGLKGKGGGAAKKVEEKAEKTVLDVKLEGFDVAAKIKVIKEVRTFTDLGLKEAKDLVEKSPTLSKKGVTKEEAVSIIAKMKEVGAKVSME